MIFQYCLEPVLIQRILMGFEAILEEYMSDKPKLKTTFHSSKNLNLIGTSPRNRILTCIGG